VDRVRFEVMRRLGWVSAPPEAEVPIIELVRRAWRLGARFDQDEAPVLAPEHPDYPAYARLSPKDRVAFLRRLIPRAVVRYRDQMEPASAE
jgi:hypothetical protein